MKHPYSLISLNLWGGHVLNPLLEFLSNSSDIDIFCFQELYDNAPYKMSTDDNYVNLNLLSEIKQRLPNHNAYFCPVIGTWYGIGMMVKKSLIVLSHGESMIYPNPSYEGKGPTHPRKLQWARIKLHNDKEVTIVNIHGLWNGQGKTDSPDRIKQSFYIKDFLNRITTPTIVCGDFNLRPDTKSLGMISANMRDLIRENNIQSTRTSLYTKEEKFADYVFTSQEDIDIKNFKTLPDEVSDHVALSLEFL